MRDSVGFSVRLYAFFAEQDRLFSECLHESVTLSTTELSLMCALYEANIPLPPEPLSQLLMLKLRTVRQMLLILEDRELVTKTSSSNDARYMLASLTSEGLQITEELTADIYQTMKEHFWSALPESDFEDTLKASMRECVNNVRGFEVEPFGNTASTKLPIACDHFVFWRTIMDRWRQTVRSWCRLNLNDYCVLELLSEDGEMGFSELSQALLMPKNILSLSKKHLAEQELILEKEDASDARRLTLSITDRGKATICGLFEKLDEITRSFHDSLDPDTRDVVQAWYARMFRNMWKSVRNGAAK